PKKDDPISTEICSKCWTRVHDFHEFYESVEKAHRLLTERFSIKSNSAEQVEQQEQAEQQEAADDSKELLLSQQDESLSGALALDDDCASGHESIEADSFSNEQFLLEVLSKQTIAADEQFTIEPIDEAEVNEKPEIDAPRIERVIETRATRAKIKADAEKQEQATAAKRGRGRPKLASKQPVSKQTSEPKRKRYVDYKQSMLEIDQKIKQHMQLACSVCCEVQPTFRELLTHMLQQHNRKGYAVCCNKKFYKRSFLTDHIDRHANPEIFKCELCDRSFADKQCLRNHELLKHQPDEEKKFICEHCPKKFTKQYLLDQHRVVHQERNVPCDLCNRRFATVSMLATHVRMLHGNYGTMCDICAKVVRGRAAFQRHQLEHAGVTEPKVQCDICGSWHKNKYSLKKHIKRHNNSSEKCTCSICGKVSPNRSAMLSHQRYVHISDRVHACSVCSKKFKKAITLKEHMATHTGEVLYKCPHCPKTFNSNANKHAHRKIRHPKEFKEARQARLQKRMEPTQSESKLITITTEDEQTHKILLSTADDDDDDDDEDFKGETIEYIEYMHSTE
ncbi:CG15073, partial [Drosophila busckii]